MKATITIECDDEQELFAHLSVIRQEVKKEVKKQNGEITKKARIYDSNCYGQHLIIVKPD